MADLSAALRTVRLAVMATLKKVVPLLALGLPLLLAAAPGAAAGKPRPAPTRDPGAELFLRKGCVACHTLAGDTDAAGTLGPDLTALGKRMPVAKVREILADPQAFSPGTTMPQLDLSRSQIDLLTRFVLTPPKTPTPAPTPTPRPRPSPTNGFGF